MRSRQSVAVAVDVAQSDQQSHSFAAELCTVCAELPEATTKALDGGRGCQRVNTGGPDVLHKPRRPGPHGRDLDLGNSAPSQWDLIRPTRASALQSILRSSTTILRYRQPATKAACRMERIHCQNASSILAEPLLTSQSAVTPPQKAEIASQSIAEGATPNGLQSTNGRPPGRQEEGQAQHQRSAISLA